MRPGHRVTRRGALLGAVMVVALAVSACSWRVGPLDGPGATGGAGRTTDHVQGDKSASAVVVIPGFSPLIEPVVAYYDQDAHRLRLAIDAVVTGWNFFEVDGSGLTDDATHTGRSGADVGQHNSIATHFVAPLASATGPVIDLAYQDTTNGRLRHARISGLAMNSVLEDVDGPLVSGGGRTSDVVGGATASVWDGTTLHIFYTAVHVGQSITSRLRHATFDGTTWTFEDVDGSGGVASGATTDSVGLGVSATVTGAGLQAFYYDQTSHRLRYANRPTGGSWTATDLDGVGGPAARTTDDVGRYNAVSGSPDGSLHDFYFDATAGRLRHAVLPNGGSWSFEDLDGAGVPGGGGRLAAVMGISPAVFAPSAEQHPDAPDVIYGNDTAHSLRRAHWTGTVWQFETIDGAGAQVGAPTSNPVGASNAAAIDWPGARVHFFTGDLSSGDLRTGCALLPFGAAAPATCN